MLWIFDEAQQILTDESKTKARKAIDAPDRRDRSHRLGLVGIGGQGQPAPLPGDTFNLAGAGTTRWAPRPTLGTAWPPRLDGFGPTEKYQ